MARRRKTPWEPICHWCKEDMTDDPGYRTPIWGEEGTRTSGLLGGWVVCSPTCPGRPEGVTLYQKRPPIAIFKQLPRDEQRRIAETTL